MKTPRGFWAVWTTVAVDLIGFGILIPLLPIYAKDFGASPATIGLLFAAYSLAQFVFSPVWGRISDRIGRRPVLLVTIVGSAVGSLVTGLAGTLPLLFLGRIIDGTSGATIAVARATVADTASDADRTRLMGLLGAAFGIGFVVGPSIGALATLGGPSLPFFVAAGISAVNLVMTYLRVDETRRSDGTSSATSGSTSVRDAQPLVLRLVAVTFIAITGFSAFEATFALLASDRLDASETTVALVFAGIGVLLVIVQGGLVGPLSRRFGDLRLLAIGLGLLTAGFAVLAVAPGWAGLGVALAVLAFGQGLITPTLSSSVAVATTPDRIGVALGWQQSASGLARVVGPILGGALFGFAVPAPYVASAMLAAIGWLLINGTGARLPHDAAGQIV